MLAVVGCRVGYCVVPAVVGCGVGADVVPTAVGDAVLPGAGYCHVSCCFHPAPLSIVPFSSAAAVNLTPLFTVSCAMIYSARWRRSVKR